MNMALQSSQPTLPADESQMRAEELVLEARLGGIPIDPRIVAAGEAGTPFFPGDAHSPAAKAFAETVDAILAADGQQTETAETGSRMRPGPLS
jgi:hypothetical protein